MTADTDQPLLERCPFCDYSLQGLPTEHRCPECGQPFDRRWRVFPGVPAWRSADFLGGVMLLVLMPVFLLRGALRSSWPIANVIPVVLPFAGLWALLAVQIVRKLRKPRVFVAVGQAGITVLDRRKGSVVHYNWRRIGEARVGWSDRVVIPIDGRDIRFDLRSRSQAWQCAEYLNSYDQPFQRE
jgi:hypothetical protein